MKLNMRLKIIALMAPIIPVLLIFFILLQTASKQAEELRNWVDNTYEVNNQLNTLFTDLLNAETGQRGFIITNDQTFLAPYLLSIEKIERDIATLYDSLSQPQLQKLDDLVALIRAKFGYMADNIHTLKKQGLPAVVPRMQGGKELMDQIRRLSAIMIAEQDRLLSKHKQEFKQASAKLQTLEIAAATGLLLFYIVMTLLLIRSVMTPLQALTKTAATLADGNYASRVELPRHDEFGALAMAFNSMAKSIQQRTLQLQDNEARLRSVIETAVEGIITINRTGEVETMNPAAEHIFGYAREQVIGQNINMLMPEPYHSQHDGYLQNYLKTDRTKNIGMRREVEGLRKDGSVFPMELAVSEMSINGKRMFTGLVRDVSERKEMERLKDEFISTVSHELRTPLTSIRGSLGLILGGATGELSEKSQQLLSIADNNCARLVRLINDILDIEKFASGKMVFDLKVIELMPLVQQTLQNNQAYAAEFGVTFVITEQTANTLVLADSDRLTQVLTNLLSNAAKFSHRGGQVDVAVTVSAGQVRLDVIDYGTGIKDEFKSKIFSKFSQEDASNARLKGGSGLGLNISKAIVEKLGGNISFDSVANQRTCFSVTLPIWQQLANTQEQDATPIQPAQKNLLILEEDPGITHELVVFLKQCHYHVDVVNNSSAALRQLKEQPYAALLLELLPGQLGIDLFKSLRNEVDQDLPVIALTAIDQQGKHELNGDAVPVIDWLDKSIDGERLQDAVAKVLGKQQRMARILHIEDDPDTVYIVNALLAETSIVDSASTLADAREKLQQPYDLVILDIALPDGSGLSILPLLSQHHDIPVVIFSINDIDLSQLSQITANFVKSKTAYEVLVNKIISILNR